MECPKHTYDDIELDDSEGLEIYKNLRPAFDKYQKNPLLRFVMTNSGKGGPSNVNEFSSWAEMLIGSSLRDVTIKDSQYILSEVMKLEKEIKHKTFANVGKLKEFLIKAATLPGDLFKYHGIGRIHEDIGQAEQLRDGRKADLNTKIDALAKKMQGLVSGSIKEGREDIAKANEQLEVARARHLAMVNKNESVFNIELASRDVSIAESNLLDVIGPNGRKANDATKLMTAISRHLNGESSYSTLVKTAMALKGRVDVKDIGSIVHAAKELTNEYSNLFEDASNKFYDVLMSELKNEMPEEDASELARSLTRYEKEETFYPHNKLLALHYKVSSLIKAQGVIKNSPKSKVIGDLKKISELAKSKYSNHAKKRKAGASFIDLNVVDVLHAYGNDVIDHNHAATVAHIGSQFLEKLSDLSVVKEIAGKPDSSEVLYAKSVKRLITGHMATLLDKPISTISDNILGSLSAFEVFSKLTSFSTSATNRFEGILMYMANDGLHNKKKKDRLFSLHESTIINAQNEAHTSLHTGVMFDPSNNPASNRALRRALSDTDILDAQELSRQRATEITAKIRDGVNKLGSKGLALTMWERGENANRKEAFNSGAAEAADFVIEKWEPRFMAGEWTEYIIDNFKLDKGLAERAKKDKSLRAELFNSFKNKYIIRQGFRSINQSQFQYTESARNFLDLNAKTSWITMFQHYPRSLASSIIWSMHNVKSLYDVGGVSALKGQITARKFGDPGSKSDAMSINHDLSRVMTLAGITLLRSMIRRKTGLILGNIMTHPFTDMLEDLYDYFADDEPPKNGMKDRTWSYLYGRKQPLRNVTGPAASTVLDVASIPAREFLNSLDGFGMSLVENGMHDGSLASYLSAVMGVGGLKTTQRAYTDNQRKNMGSVKDILVENALHSFSVYNKGQRLTNAIVRKNSKDIIINSSNFLFGVRTDWSIARKRDYKG